MRLSLLEIFILLLRPLTPNQGLEALVDLRGRGSSRLALASDLEDQEDLG